MVRETVPHVAEAATFDVLLDGVERLLLTDFHLSVGPTRNLDDHVQDAIVLIGKEGDVVEGGHDRPTLLYENTVLWKTIDEISSPS